MPAARRPQTPIGRARRSSPRCPGRGSAPILLGLGLALAACPATTPHTATVTPGAAEATAEAPALTREQLRDTVAYHQAELRQCYDRGRAVDAALRGQVVLRMAIAGEGTVDNADVITDELRATIPARDTVAACIAAAARGWTFPSHGRSPLVVAYPLILTDDPAAIAAAPPNQGLGETLAAHPHPAGDWYPAPELPPRSVVIEVRDPLRRPLAGQPVTLAIVDPEGTRRRVVRSDHNGRAIFGDIPAYSELEASLEPVASAELPPCAECAIRARPVTIGEIALGTTLVTRDPTKL